MALPFFWVRLQSGLICHISHQVALCYCKLRAVRWATGGQSRAQVHQAALGNQGVILFNDALAVWRVGLLTLVLVDAGLLGLAITIICGVATLILTTS